MAATSVDVDELFGDAPAPRSRLWQRCEPVIRRVTQSLKLRLAVGALLALWAGMAVTAWHLAGAAKHDMLAQAEQRELSEAQHLASLVERRVGGLQRALALIAAEIDAGPPLERDALAAYLDREVLLRAHFANVFIARPDGSFVAFQDAAGQRLPSTPIDDRPYFRRLQEVRQPVISDAVVGRISGEPVVVLAHPLRWPDGGTGTIGGALRLASRDLLAELTHPHAADQGTLTVITDRNGRVLAHPERQRLMQALAQEPRLAASFQAWQARVLAQPQTQAQAQDASPGTWDTGSDIVAAATDPLTGWTVWRVVSHQSLLSAVRRAEARALWASAGTALLLTALLLVYTSWQLLPLAQLRRAAQSLRDGGVPSAGQPDVRWPEADGEIGELARTLRHVWAERSQVESFNNEVLERLHSVMAAAPVGLTFTRNARFELVSAELCALLGRSEAQLVGQPTRPIFAANADYEAMSAAVQAAFAGGQPYVGEWSLLREDGRTFWARLRARPVAAGDPEAGAIWSINDISDQVAARARLEHAALHDALTAVANRKGFELQIRAVMARRGEGHDAALVMLDLDGFKPVNDTHGHAAGDALLVAVAQTLSRQVRGSDVVARLGGDEFALLLPACDLPVALRLAEKARRAITGVRIDWDGHALGVGASLGVAVLEAAHADEAQWLAAADAACYAAKRGGRNQVCAAAGQLSRLPGPSPAPVVALHESAAG